MVVAAGNAAWRSLRLRAAPVPRSRLARGGAWLVLAPHPDDETLGAGGLIARLAAEGNRASVVFLTAGEASHVGAPQWPPERLARTRKDEARLALSALERTPSRPIHLDWRDGNPAAPDGGVFRRSCALLGALCRQRNIRNIAATWRGEGHCDHQTTFALARAVAARSRGAVELFEYLVWGWTDPLLLRKVAGHAVVTVAAARQRAARRLAISRHRTQILPIVRNAQEEFRLPADMIALAIRDPVILLCERLGHHAP